VEALPAGAAFADALASGMALEVAAARAAGVVTMALASLDGPRSPAATGGGGNETAEDERVSDRSAPVRTATKVPIAIRRSSAVSAASAK
jgi:hypothetical protein